MLILLCLLSTCFIQLSIGAPSRREDGSGIKLNEGEVLFEGDIILTKEQAAAMKESSRAKRQAVLNQKRWGDDTVNYYYDSNMGSENIRFMEAAIEYIRSRTCVNFVKNDKATNRIRIMSNGGCASPIGFQGVQQQTISFGNDCLMLGTAVQQLMRALGVDNEQKRFDRDKYLNVNGGNISKAMGTTENSYISIPFDFGSSMLAEFDEFGSGTIQPKDMEYKWTMGNRRVSFYDIVKINEHFKCKRKCNTQLECKNGGYTNPANCNVCNCPRGYEGVLCDQDPASKLYHKASTEWISYFIGYGPSVAYNFIHPFYAYVVITAPAQTTVEIQLIQLDNFNCSKGCNSNGVEVKAHGDPRVTNPVFCCDNEINDTKTITVKQLPARIELYSKVGVVTLTYRYRYIHQNYQVGNKTTNGFDCFDYWP